jgi:hypothetical protein
LLCVVAACGRGSTASEAIVPLQVSRADPPSLVGALANQITAKQLADGAILNTSTSINGYFANYSAIGLVVAGRYSSALAWAKWYAKHVNAPGVWGQGCSIYDYQYVDGKESSTGTASSVDAHGASYITLLKAMYRSGDAASVTYVKSVRPQVECITLSVTSLIASNGLAQVKPGNNIQYLIDNAQVYRGLGDAAWLEANAWGETQQSALYASLQKGVAKGIATMWNSGLNMYASYTTPSGHIDTPTWSTWYADSTAQLFLVINGVLKPSDPRAVGLYKAFNAAWPRWTLGTSGNPSGFPWAAVAQAAAAMGDTARVNAYAANVDALYGGVWSWPWFDYESACLIHALVMPLL